MFDIGIHQRLLGLEMSEHMLKNPLERISKGVRFSHENFARMEKIEVMPIYAVSTLWESTGEKP